ncbi:MAG TPA: molybdenum cofactor guanylyltransferase [Chthoniobacterales bacterium]|jgi:molybdopterin-guanine dinucleotide biosynthesis protein A
MKISAVLLAGGESRRMGQDKATMLWRGRPLWQNQIDTLRKLGPTELLISARSDPAWRPADAVFVSDDPPFRGPLSGITAALAAMKETHLLTLAIDMPFMSDAYLRSLCDLIKPGRGVLPVMDDRAEPLAAIYPAETRSHFVAALGGKNFSLQAITKELIQMKTLHVVGVSREEEKFFRNVNEPGDIADL